jgi:serine/threonine-protein kinase
MGVVLYEALSGEKPFTGESFMAVAQVVESGDHRPLLDVAHERDLDVDPAIAAVVERAMQRDPSDRFASAEAMADALAGRDGETAPLPVAAAGEETTLIATDALTETQVNEVAPLAVPPRRRRMPLMVPLAVAAALFVLLLVVLGLAGGSDKSPATNISATTTPTTAAPPSTTIAPVETTPAAVEQTTPPPRPAPKNAKKGRRGNRN